MFGGVRVPSNMLNVPDQEGTSCMGIRKGEGPQELQRTGDGIAPSDTWDDTNIAPPGPLSLPRQQAGL